MAENFDWTISRKIQYNNSKTLNAILEGLNTMIKFSPQAFLNGVLNIDTAVGTQLDAIGALLGASRIITFPNVLDDENLDFGFDASEWGGFDEFGGTFDVKPPSTTTLKLEDNAYRTYIKFKAYANVSNCSLYSINYMLGRIFEGRGNCYVMQTGETELFFIFDFALLPFERNLIVNRYIPIPAGYSLLFQDTQTDWKGKPADWSDIRNDCPENSIALYAGHETLNYSDYDYVIINGRLIWANPKIYLNSASTGMNQRYIDTGYVPNQKTNITIKASCSGSSSGIYVPFGQRTEGAYNTSTEQVYLNFAANAVMFYGQNKTTSAWETDTVYTLNYTDARTNTSSEYPIYLFNINNKGTNANGYFGNIYFVKFFDENNNLLHHYVPVPQGLEIGNFTCPSNSMFDIVEQEFLTPVGTFTYGGADPSDLNIKTSVQYDNLGFTATCTGGYNVYIDGVQYGTTYASGANCNITWSTSGITTGEAITTPSALTAHKIWIEPATEGRNITRFASARVSTGSENEYQGKLWIHFNLSNTIQVSNLLCASGTFSINDICKAITAKNNTLNCTSNMSSMCQNGASLEYLPVLVGSGEGVAAGGIFNGCENLKSITLKNFKFTNINYGFNTCYNLETIKNFNVEILNSLANSTINSTYNECRKLRNILPETYTSYITRAQNYIHNTPELKDIVFDLRGATALTELGVFSTNSTCFAKGIKGVCVSNEAPFNRATTPQIDVRYTNLDRTALVQLFQDLPTVSSGQIINIVGCTGVSDLTADDEAIATVKGWTITK